MFYISMDLETTGLDICKDEPVQFAAVVYSGTDRQHRTEMFYINTAVPINEKAQAVHKIDKEKLEVEGLDPAAAADRWHNLVWEFQPVVVLGYNLINFDFPMWQNFLAHYKVGAFKHPPVIQVIDVMHLVSRQFRTRKWLKLVDAANKLRIKFDPTGLHDALVDVELTWEVYKELMR